MCPVYSVNDLTGLYPPQPSPRGRGSPAVAVDKTHSHCRRKCDSDLRHSTPRAATETLPELDRTKPPTNIRANHCQTSFVAAQNIPAPCPLTVSNPQRA